MERRNNFDLIRLLAALQVAAYHGIVHFHVPIHPLLWKLLETFPGVQSFFCISGFLIARSVERNRHDLKAYAWSRVLRIYPVLILCSTVWFCLMFVLGVFHGVEWWRVASWYSGAVAIGGSGINPNFFRGFGIGVWNGALWTVGVEIAFYVLLPILYLLDRWGPAFLDRIFFVLCLASFALFLYFDGLHYGDTIHFGALTKAVWFSLPGNLWMLLFGTIIHRQIGWLGRLLSGKVVWWLGGYIVLVFSTHDLAAGAGGKAIEAALLFVVHLVLALLTVSAAYSFHGLGDSLLKGNDISYGLYVYHLPVYNLFIQYGLGTAHWFPAAILGAILCGYASWIFLERRMLGLKNRVQAAAGRHLKPAKSGAAPGVSRFRLQQDPIE